MAKLLYKSALAGGLIGLAACVYMSCENKYVGAFLFSLGLIAVILLQANLFTGKIGYVDSVPAAKEAVLILAVNTLTAYIVGIMYSLSGLTAVQTVATRFENFDAGQVLFKAFGTGVCIYLGVELYKKKDSLIPVILSVMCFILGGMYHCVADACYLGTIQLTDQSIIYLVLVIIGNSLGSLTIRQLQLRSEL